MFQRLAPTLLAYGGTYANTKELNIENILPFAFPFGIGGPKMKRKVKVSHELCIQHYEVIIATIHGRPNNFSDESHTQQTNVIQDWSDGMQVNS